MESLHREYEEAIWQLLRSARRFGKQIELFRDADIGDEMWKAVGAGSYLVTALRYSDEATDYLIHELGQLGAIKREQLNYQDRKVDEALKELGVSVMIWVVDASARENSRVKCVTVAYAKRFGLTTAQITGKVETALDRAILNEEKGVVYATDLKYYLEENEGLYGVALQDSRDERYDWLLAGVIAKGRLLTHLRYSAGLPKREPKKKKVDHAKI